MFAQMKHRLAVAGIGILGCAIFPGAAYGQGYPSKPIRLIVPFSPGGGLDSVARLLGQKLSTGFGQQVIVDNRPGAGGRIGTVLVAQSAPDGYTLLVVGGSVLITAPALYPKLPYDPLKDFSHISLLASATYVLAVHPSVPVNSVKKLIALAKSKPGRLNYSSPGGGSIAHLAAELLSSMAGVKMVHIPYKGSAPGTIALISGETDLMFSNIVPVVPAIKGKRLRPLAITSLKRSPLLPDVPTMSESGLPGFEAEQFYGLLAPAGIPRNIVKRLNEEVVTVMQSPEIKNRLLGDGAQPVGSTPEEFEKLIRTEISKWRKVIKEAGIEGE